MIFGSIVFLIGLVVVLFAKPIAKYRASLAIDLSNPEKEGDSAEHLPFVFIFGIGFAVVGMLFAIKSCAT